VSVVRYRAAKDVEIMRTVGVYSRLKCYDGFCCSIVLVRNSITNFLGYLKKWIAFPRPRIEPRLQSFRLCIKISAGIMTA
jgi:hypothetical protein